MMSSHCLAILLTLLPASDAECQAVVLVVGAAGSEEFGQRFQQSAVRWEDAARRAHAAFSSVGQNPIAETQDKQLLHNQLQEISPSSREPLWLVLVGHGTFDGQTAKFNLRGPDVSAADLSAWLKPFARPLAIIDGSSASAPFINQLSGKNRVVVTATKSGHEYNYARFGEYFSAAILDPQADLDKDEQTSLLEAFLSASATVQGFYVQEARLATEHALLDDNGDGLGTPADWFRGVRAVRSAKDGALPDGLLANQFCLIRSAPEQAMSIDVRSKRDALEMHVARLREEKPRYTEDEYYRRLEAVLLDLARLYSQTEPVQRQDSGGP